MPSVRTAAVLAPLLLASCSLRVQQTIDTDTSPTRSSGYVGVMGWADTPETYGLGLVNDASVYFTVPFARKLRLVELPAGTYHVAYFAFWRDGSGRRAPVRVDHPVAQPFELRAGEVVILGHWRPKTSYEAFRGDGYRVEWSLNALPLTAVEASRAVHARYPEFAAVPVKCLVCDGPLEAESAVEADAEPESSRAGWRDPRLPGRRSVILGGGSEAPADTTGDSQSQDATRARPAKPASSPDPRLPKPHRNSGDVTDTTRPSSTPWIDDPVE